MRAPDDEIRKLFEPPREAGFYFVYGKTPEAALRKSIRYFNLLVKKRMAGLVLSKLTPKIMRGYGLERYREYALLAFNLPQEKELRDLFLGANQLGGILTRLEGFVERNRKTVVLLDSIESLIANHDFKMFAEYLAEFYSWIAFDRKSQSVILVPMSKKAVGERQVGLLAKAVDATEID